MESLSMFDQLMHYTDRPDANRNVRISCEEFEQWKCEYMFDALRGIKYGKSFCNRFGVHDNLLEYVPADLPTEWIDDRIKKHYVA
jgi:hypothetical protein